MNGFGVLKDKKFFYFYITVFLSNVGSWVQNIAMSWLALSLKNASFSLGVINFLNSLPSLIFSIIGGYLADAFDNKKILLFAQSISLIIALSIGVSVYNGSITYWRLAVLAFISGIGSAISYPIYYNILVSFVSPDRISSVIALNSLQFNLSRFIGPSLFGVLVYLIGIGGCFIINGFSYLPFLFVVLMTVNVIKKQTKFDRNFIYLIKSGLNYISSERNIFSVIKVVFLYSLLVLPFLGILPYHIKNAISDSPQTVAIVMGLLGVGTILGSLFMTMEAKDSLSILKRFKRSAYAFSSSLILLGFISNIYIFCFVSIVIGFFMVLFYASANSFIHLSTKEEYRGRIASVFTTVYLGIYPIGVLVTGFLAEFFSLKYIFVIQALISLVYLIFFSKNYRKKGF
ncbi:MAG: MFS transporter [Proteobacteria bacterium]|nr:MFS transporter [Pseudomonadota bacterium]